MRSRVLVTAALVAVAAFVALLARSEGERDAEVAVVTSPAVARPWQSEGTPVPVSTTPLDRSRGGPAARMQQDYLAATDLRVFALDAMRRPAEGGYLYGMAAADECGWAVRYLDHAQSDHLETEVRRAATVSFEQLAAIDRLRRRCGTFVGQEASDLWKSIRDRSADRLDPLVNAVGEASRALQGKDRAALRTTVQALLDLDDPLALTSKLALAFAMNRDLENRPQGALWFEGRFHSANDEGDYATFVQALELSQCRSGLPCTLSQSMLLTCFAGAICTSDPAEWMRRQLRRYDATEALIAKVFGYEAQIRAAIAERRVDSFIR